MPLPTYYAAGTASVANGDTTVTFSGAMLGTEVMPNIMAGDLFLDPAQPEIPPQRIASIDYGAGTAELSADWPGTTMSDDPYEVRYIGIIERSTAQNRRYLEMLGQLQALGIQPNAFGEFADREVYDDERKGFIFLSLDGDGDENAAWTLYAKLSGDSADWDAGQKVEGAQGPQGKRGWSPIHGIVADGARRVQVLLGYVGGEGEAPTDHVGEYVAVDGYTETIGNAVDIRGTAGIDGIDGESFNWAGAYDNGTAYDEDDVVQHNGSSWIALQATTGNVPPTLPTTANDYWELVAAKGADGAGAGDVTAAASIADGALVVGDGGGKGIKEHPGGAPGTAAFANAGDFAAAAAGVPSGGTTGQVLAKASSTDHDTEWVEQSGGLGGSTGSSDNRLLRSDGTDGSTVQSSPITVEDNGVVTGVLSLILDGSITAGTGVNTTGSFSSTSTNAASNLLADRYEDNASRGAEILGRRARGTTGSPSAIQDGDTIVKVTGRAYDGSSFVNGDRARFQFLAAETWESGKNGTKFALDTCVIGGTATATRLTVQRGLVMSGATGGDKGDGTINATAVYDDNSLLTCMALQEEFLDRGEIDLDKWDGLVPDLVVPERREEVPVLWPVQVVEEVPVVEPDEQGRLVRRVETVERTVEVPAVIADPVYDETGNIVDAIETPLVDEIVEPAQVVKREHRTARIFKAMIDDGFDPRDPEQYFAKMREDQALPGMPTQADWEHNGLSIGEQFSRKWLAMEMLAIVCNVMWIKLKEHEQRIEALEGGSRV